MDEFVSRNDARMLTPSAVVICAGAVILGASLVFTARVRKAGGAALYSRRWIVAVGSAALGTCLIVAEVANLLVP
jgi:hypothetical protein